MRKFLKDLFTEPDGQSFCIAKLMGLGSFLSFHGAIGWDMVMNHIPFNPTGYAAAIGALFTSLGGLLLMKKDTPPKAPE